MLTSVYITEALQRSPRNSLLATQVHETIDPGPFAEVEARFEWSAPNL